MKNISKVLILLFSIVLISVSTVFWYSSSKVLNVIEHDMTLKVNNDIIGFNLDPGALHFGKIPPGAGGHRSVFITNEYDFPVKINIKTYGPFRDWVSADDNNFILNSSQTKNITFHVDVPHDAVNANMTGSFKVYFIRV